MKKMRNYVFRNNIITSITIMLILFALFYTIFTRYYEADVKDKNHIIVSTISYQIEELLKDPIADLNIISELIKIMDFNDYNIEAYLEILVKNTYYLEGLEVIDESGNVKYIAPYNSNLIGLSRINQNYYKAIKNDEEIYFSNSFISEQTRNPTITLAKKHYDVVLVAYFDLESISLLSRNLSDTFGNNMSVIITDSNGVYLSYKDLDKVYQREYYQDIEIIRSSIKEEGIYKKKHENNIITAKQVNYTDWYVIVYQSLDVFYSNLRQITLITFGFSILALLISISISMINLKRGSRPFYDIIDQTKELAKGNYNHFKLEDSFEEINQLGESIYKMTNEIKIRDEKLKQLAYYDPVTKLANIRYLYDFLEKNTDENSNYGNKMILINFQLNELNRINRIYGRVFLEEILIRLGKRMLYISQKNNKKNSFFSRINEVDFIYIINSPLDKEEIIDMALILKEELDKPFIFQNNEIHFNINMGIVICQEYPINPDELIRNANTARILSEESLNTNYMFFKNAMMHDFIRKSKLEKDLENAILSNEMFLEYQPQVEGENLKIRGFEALIRWNHPELGRISPFEFISIAEESGNIIPLGEWVIINACKKILELKNKYNKNFVVAVNVSTLQLRSRDFIDNIKKIISSSNIPPELLELEITESVFIHSIKDALEILKGLEEIGVSIALDDFGTGYSSLSYLKDLPIKTLKIDKSFIRALENEKNTFIMLESIISMAHKIGMDVVAEGIETRPQLERVFNYKCNIIQGYYISKPLAEEKIIFYLEKHL